MPSNPVTNFEQLPDLMKAKDVCAWLQLSQTMIYSLVAAKQIPHYRICQPGSRGGRGVLRFKKDELRRWWEQQREKAA
jgi:excisionase family DNA binding protein